MSYTNFVAQSLKLGPAHFYAKHINQMDRAMWIQFFFTDKTSRMMGKKQLLSMGVPERAITLTTQGGQYRFRHKIQVNKY